MTYFPPRVTDHIEVDPAERTYSDAQTAAERARAMAIACNHPSAQGLPAPEKFDDFHATVTSLFDTPSSLPELETHVTGIGAAARRLAAQVARRDRGR